MARAARRGRRALGAGRLPTGLGWRRRPPGPPASAPRRVAGRGPAGCTRKACPARGSGGHREGPGRGVGGAHPLPPTRVSAQELPPGEAATDPLRPAAALAGKEPLPPGKVSQSASLTSRREPGYPRALASHSCEARAAAAALPGCRLRPGRAGACGRPSSPPLKEKSTNALRRAWGCAYFRPCSPLVATEDTVYTKSDLDLKKSTRSLERA